LLAAEAAVDITPTLSVAGLFFLTGRQTPQIGLRYRLNDNLLFRVTSDFSNETRAVVEYEARF
jgi:translocation and assembly module TamB